MWRWPGLEAFAPTAFRRAPGGVCVFKCYHKLLAKSAVPSYFAIMNSKQTKTLTAVFRKPTSATIAWSDIESLLQAVGCGVIEGPGSSVSFKHGEMIQFFHRPHPQKEAKRYQVRAVAAFLERLGVTP
jgi:hypothetical protein